MQTNSASGAGGTPGSLNKTLAHAIGKIVDDRVRAGFAERDNVLKAMMGSLNDVAELLRDRTRAMKMAEERRQPGHSYNSPRHRLASPTDPDLGFKTPRHTLQKPSVPYRPLGGSTMTPGYFSPRRSRVRDRSIIISKKTRTGKNRLGYDSKTLGRGGQGFIVTQRRDATSLRLLDESSSAKASPRKNFNNRSMTFGSSTVDPDAPTLYSSIRDETTGALVLPGPEKLPRVARSDFHQKMGYTSPRNRAQHNEKEWTRKTLHALENDTHRLKSGYDGAKTAIFRPTGFQPTQRDRDPPPKGLILEWVYGYGRSRDLSAQLSVDANFHRLATSELCWPTAGICVIFDENRMSQRFFVGHDGEVSCIAVSKHDGLTVASGQMGTGRAKVCIWTAGSWASLDVTKNLENDQLFPRYCPEICKPLQLAIGTGVAAVDSTPDGEFLSTIAINMHHTLTLWDWRNRRPLKSVRSHPSPVYLCKFNPFQHFVSEREIGDQTEEGQSHNIIGERVYTCVTGGARHLKVWTIRLEQHDEDSQLSPLAKQQYNNANAGNANTGNLSLQDRELFSSFRQTGLKDVDGQDGSISAYQRGQWRSSFKPKETDKRGVDRVGWTARQAKNRTLNEVPVHKLELQNSEAANSSSLHKSAVGKSMAWSIEGSMCRCRRIPNVPKEKLPGRDVTLCCCFLPNGLGTGGACISGSSTGRITLWHQQVEAGASIFVRRKGSKRGIMDRVVTGWDPVGWQGVSIPDAHNGKSVTAIASVMDHAHESQARFISGGKDNRVILWGCASEKVAEEAPRKLLVLHVDSYPISLLPSYNKCFVATARTGCVELDITGETPQLRPLSILDGHRHQVTALDTFPEVNVPVFATTGGDANVRLWSMRERRMMTHAMLPAAGTCVAFSANGKLLAVGTIDGATLVYGVRSGYPPGLDLRFQDVPSKDAKSSILASGRDPAGGWPAPNPVNTKSMTQRTDVEGHRPGDGLVSPPRHGGGIKTNDHPRVAFGSTTRRRQENSSRRSKTFAMTAVKFSPDGDHLVAASRDRCIYLYERWKDQDALPGSFRLKRILKGHWAAVTHVDWSLDSTTIMSNGADREVLYWNAVKGKQDKATLRHRDKMWASWTCVLGWPVQGAWSGRQDRGIVHDIVDKAARGFMSDKFRKDDVWLQQIREGAHKFGDTSKASGSSVDARGDIFNQRKLAVDIINLLGACRSHSGKLLATGDDQSQVSLFRFPAVKGAKPKRYRGHGASVLCCRFTADDRFLLTAGGSDGTIFLWHTTAVDNDPSLLSLNFAASHLETKHSSKIESLTPLTETQSTPKKYKRYRGGLEMGNTVTDGNMVTWGSIDEKEKETDHVRGSVGRDESVEKAWDYLEGRSDSLNCKTDDAMVVSSGPISDKTTIAEDKKRQDAMMNDEIEERKKWNYLEDDSGKLLSWNSLY